MDGRLRVRPPRAENRTSRSTVVDLERSPYVLEERDQEHDIWFKVSGMLAISGRSSAYEMLQTYNKLYPSRKFRVVPKAVSDAYAAGFKDGQNNK